MRVARQRLGCGTHVVDSVRIAEVDARGPTPAQEQRAAHRQLRLLGEGDHVVDQC